MTPPSPASIIVIHGVRFVLSFLPLTPFQFIQEIEND